ncbi:hypothetical protein YQE_10729, partial [Dendroctonus ponderosae]
MPITHNDLIQQKTENVKVFIRLRPLEPHEICSNISLIDDQNVKIWKAQNENDVKIFQFNKVFNQKATQLELYQMVASPLVDQALSGYNGTIFAYGQSGTGKTFTILGKSEDRELRGIVPNMFSHILTQISLAKSSTSYLVTITFLEIYNEKIRDLLSPSNRKLEVRESPELGVYVKNLSGITVESSDQALDIISKASKNRTSGSTNLNSQSSRSHAIFSVRIEAKHEDESLSLGKLNLVDLAGSERVSKSFATGQRLKEAVKINLSLSVLGNVISALVDGNITHIPYRNSKLTRLLQDSLGGNSMTSIIATISPSREHFEETCYTLMYADRAKNIKNTIKRNEENKSFLEGFREKINALKLQLEELNKVPQTPKTRPKLSKRNPKKEQEDELHATNQLKKLLLDKIEVLQKKVLVGGENLIDKSRQQMELLDHSAKQIQQLDSSHELLQETLHCKLFEKSAVEMLSLSLQEEDKLLDLQILEAEKQISKSEKLLFTKESEYQNEISNLLYTNKCLARELQMANYVVGKHIPKGDLEKVRENIYWDEEAQEYRLKLIAHCGNNLKKISLHIEKGPIVQRAMKKRYRKYPNE